MTMKKIGYLTLIMLFAIILGACAKATPQPADEMINPGDKIGDFLITSSGDDSVIYTTKVHCPFDPSTKTETCEIDVGTKVNVALGVYGDSVEKLDMYWSGQTYKMTIEGRPVNLQAFGSIDITHPIVGKMRLWNVVIVTDKPGKITIQHSGEIAGDSAEGMNILIYSKS
jgi:hypothetical protein